MALDIIPKLLSLNTLYVLASSLLLIVTYAYFQSKKARLDHIPGPWLAKYTDAWRCFQAWRINHYEENVNYQINLIGRYGDVVRIGPNIVLCFDPEAISTIYSFKERLLKGPGYKVFVMTGTTQTALVGIPDDKTHASYRRPIAHAFTLSSLRGYEPYIDEMIKKFTDVLDRHELAGEPINMSDWLHYWAFDVISKITFGEPIGFLQHGYDFNGMIKSQKRFFRYISIVNNMPILDAFLKRNPLLKLVRQKPSMFFTFAKKIVTDRIAKAEEDTKVLNASSLHHDLLGSFIAARNTYPVMTDLRITHVSTTTVVAGANDSASSMNRIIHFLASHPDAQERLYKEITDASVSAVKNKESDVPAAFEMALNMPYLSAVISESYRLFGVPSNNQERIVSESGMRLPNGIELPPGTVVAMNAASIAMLPHVFGEDAHVFNPDRWFQGSAEGEEEFQERRTRMERANMIFSHGSRSCIGKNVVQLEMFKLWATLLRVYRFEPIDINLHNVIVLPRKYNK